MMLAIKEYFKPKLKCERIGHNMVTINIRIRKPSNDFGRVIARDHEAKMDYCKRCGEEHSEPYDLDYGEGIHTLSMPSSYFRRMEKDGYLRLD